MLHMTGSPTRLIAEEHVANLDCISGGRYYSKETVNAMETDYLTRIAELKTEVLSLALHDDTEFKNAARQVISCMHSTRHNSRSTRPGKINNQTRMRCWKARVTFMVRAYWPGLAAFKEACVKRCRWILLNFSTINVVVYCYYYFWLKKITAEIE